MSTTPTTLDICGLNEGALVGFAPITAVTAVACALFIHDRALSLEDQRTLTLMLGLDATPAAPQDREDRPRVRPDLYRRGKRGRG